MKKLCVVGLFVLVWMSPLSAEQLEIEVHGMTCAFCVDSLQRNLRKLPDVESAQVSLKHKKVRIETIGNAADTERIRQTVLDSGFTPIKITPSKHAN